MTSKRQRRLAKRRSAQEREQQRITSDDERYHPKPGPGQVFARELIGMDTGHAKRFRNIGESPLILAYWRGQLCSPAGSNSKIDAESRKAAGEQFERLWRMVHASGWRDSTNLGISGSDRLFWSEAKEQASKDLAHIAGLMPVKDFVICKRFCGEGWSMRDSLRGAGVEADPRGTPWRIREALDELVYATGRAMRDARNANGATAAATNVTPLHPFQEGA